MSTAQNNLCLDEKKTKLDMDLNEKFETNKKRWRQRRERKSWREIPTKLRIK